MSGAPVRASADWLALREPADAAARSTELVDELVALLPQEYPVVHDLGCGSGSMARWLAPRLPGRQRWVLHDRDAELLDRVDVGDLDVEVRHGDITRLTPKELADADLVTASALLDMLTADELARLVDVCVTVGCPVLIALTVLGRVELTPADPLDRQVMEAFNEHQRRETAAGPLLGPDAVTAAVRRFTACGREVVVRPSPWRLGPDSVELAATWLSGWVGAATEQQPGLEEMITPYARRRLAAAAERSLSVVVHHADLLVRPAGSRLPRDTTSSDGRGGPRGQEPGAG